MNTRIWAASALALTLSQSTLAQAPAPSPTPSEVSVSVDVNRPGPVIDRHIYGQFAEHLGHGIYDGIWVGEGSKIPNIRGYRTDVINALKEIKVPVVRWPGGCFGDLYDWRDGIGPRSKRPVRINVHWGGVTEDNSFGTHEFMNFTELLGADAYVSLNVGSMTPLDSARWLEYMTSNEKATLADERRRNGRDKPWTVKFLGIGNETWGCGGNMSGEYAAEVNARYSTFVTAPAEMGMVKVASGATGNGGDYKAFTEAMMKGGGKLQALSFHYYAMPAGGKRGPATGFDESLWTRELDLTRKMETFVSDVSAVMDKYDPDKKVALYVDEWGSWYDQEPGSHPGFLLQQNSLRDAEVAALSLNIFHRHTDRVKMTNIAQMINVLQAMILTDGPKFLRTPTYWVYHMYVPFQEATPLPASVATPAYTSGSFSMPQVDASAARGTDGKLYLSLVNTDPVRSARVTTNLTGTATGRILTGPAMDSHNSFDAPDAVSPKPYSGRSENGRLVFDLPARAVAVVAIP